MDASPFITTNLLGRRVSVSYPQASAYSAPDGEGSAGEVVGLMLQPGACDPRALVLLDSGTLMTFPISSLTFPSKTVGGSSVVALQNVCPSCCKKGMTLKVDDSGRDPAIDKVSDRWMCSACGHVWNDDAHESGST